MLSRSANIFSVFVLLSVTAIALLLYSKGHDLTFAYSREAIHSGKFWSAFSGHLWHATFAHLLMNLAAWGLVWLYAYSILDAKAWVLILLVCMVGTSFGLYQFQPHVIYYSGFSGVLHGLLVAISLCRLRMDRRDISAYVALLLVVVKMVYEQNSGALPWTEEMAGVRVLVHSHLYGALSGALAGGILFFMPRKKTHLRTELY